ncbi:hypothetical protein IV417_12355 [Alphaproteobacteria bacterium KMM 3653]|uniref:Uncharacterized protein n=1 Tax=Harenicola maris TaxID=2841044 RepID=A0AAP2G8Q1_9RHOB|nr:hypothetical protein [Harenicola maris]
MHDLFKAPKPQRDLHKRVEAQPVAYWFIIVVLGLFAVMCLLSFADRMGHAGADEYMMLAAGLFLVWATYRSVRYFLWPVVSVTGEHFVLFRFWRPGTRWTYHWIERFEVSVRRIEVRDWNRGGRRTGRVLYVEDLVAVGKDGRRRRAVLPGFAGRNEEVLTALSARSGIEMVRVETEPL